MKAFSLISILSGNAALLRDVGPNFVISTSGIRMDNKPKDSKKEGEDKFAQLLKKCGFDDDMQLTLGYEEEIQSSESSSDSGYNSQEDEEYQALLNKQQNLKNEAIPSFKSDQNIINNPLQSVAPKLQNNKIIQEHVGDEQLQRKLNLQLKSQKPLFNDAHWQDEAKKAEVLESDDDDDVPESDDDMEQMEQIPIDKPSKVMRDVQESYDDDDAQESDDDMEQIQIDKPSKNYEMMGLPGWLSFAENNKANFMTEYLSSEENLTLLEQTVYCEPCRQIVEADNFKEFRKNNPDEVPLLCQENCYSNASTAYMLFYYGYFRNFEMGNGFEHPDQATDCPGFGSQKDDHFTREDFPCLRGAFVVETKNKSVLTSNAGEKSTFYIEVQKLSKSIQGWYPMAVVDNNQEALEAADKFNQYFKDVAKNGKHTAFVIEISNIDYRRRCGFYIQQDMQRVHNLFLESDGKGEFMILQAWSGRLTLRTWLGRNSNAIALGHGSDQAFVHLHQNYGGGRKLKGITFEDILMQVHLLDTIEQPYMKSVKYRINVYPAPEGSGEMKIPKKCFNCRVKGGCS